MRNAACSTVDPRTGSVNYSGPSEIMRGDHRNMPPRTSAYLPGDERGHVQASSLGGSGGSNAKMNIVPQSADVNHGGYYSMEQGERRALQNGAEIYSNKTAYASNQPGARPDAFMVTDTVTYADGHTEKIHHSFANESYVDQAVRNEQSAALPDTFTAPNPGDSLRDAMDPRAYSDLMEETDPSLPSIDAEYAQADFSGMPSVEAWDSGFAVEVDGHGDAALGSCAEAEDAAIEAAVEDDIRASSACD